LEQTLNDIKKMALLAQLKELSEESQIQVITAYDQQFPFEVRCALAEWIESKLWWSGLDPDNLYDENFASNLVLDLIKETELRANNENNFIEKFKLNKAAQQFRNDYSHNPFLLIRIIKNCLNTEFKAIEQSKNYLNNTNNNLNPQIRDPNQEINEELAKVRKQTKETKEEVRRLHQEREQYIIDQQKKIERQRHIQQINVRFVDIIKKFIKIPFKYIIKKGSINRRKFLNIYFSVKF
jgi:hypothetical protein